MPRSIIGIDIRNSSISAVHLISGFKGSVVKNFTRIKIVTSDKKSDPLAEGLTALARKIDFTNATAVIGIPPRRLFFRNLEVPFDDPKKIRQVLPFELEPTLPIPVETTQIDFVRIKAAGSNLLTAAVEKSFLDHYLSALSQAGIRPCMVVPSGYPLALRLVQAEQATNDGLIIDTEDNNLTIFLTTAGQVAKVRTLQTATNTAEGIDLGSTLIRQALLGYSLLSSRRFSPQKIWLTGNGLANKSMMRQMAQKLEHTLDFTNLLETIPEIKLNGTTGKWRPALMDNALSLALLEAEGSRSINFFKRRSTLMAAFGEHRKNLTATAMLAILVALLGLGKIGVETARLKHRIKALDKEIIQTFKQSFPRIKRIVDPLHQMKVELNQERRQAESPTGGPMPIKMIDILAQISRCIDQQMKVHLTRLVAGSESITLAGRTTGFKVVDTIKGRLEKMPEFEKVTITSATTDKSGKQIQFKLRIKPTREKAEP